MKNNLLIAIRPYQWLKNFFIFLPLVFGERLFNFMALLKTAVVFAIFSLAASSVYLMNDIVDLESDRKHPVKRLRPLASGKITILQAKTIAIFLSSAAVFFAFILDARVGAIILAYLILNLVYTLILKNAVIIDVFCIGAFYYLRILVGSISSDVKLSDWIILCTVLLALFLGFNKRRYDLVVAIKSKVVYREYSRYFIDRMISVISASIIMSYALYTMDAQTIQRFGTEHMIYTIPFVFYGIFRYLYLVDRRGFGGDAAFALLKDRKIQLNLFLWVVVCTAIIYLKI